MKTNFWNLWDIEEIISQKILNVVDKNIINHIDYLKCKLGLETFIINICKLIAIYTCATLSNTFFHTLIFHISFLFLRIFSYGYHAKTSLGCIFSSLIMFIFIPYSILNFIILPPITLYLLSSINMISLSFFAPKKTKKNYIGDRQQQYKLKKRAVLSCLLMSTIAFLVPSLIFKNIIILGNSLAVCLILPFKKEKIK